MRAYRVTMVGSGQLLGFAGSKGDARSLRDDAVEKYGVKKKEIDIDDEVEIPTKKDELIPFLNELVDEMRDTGRDSGDPAAKPTPLI